MVGSDIRVQCKACGSPCTSLDLSYVLSISNNFREASSEIL